MHELSIARALIELVDQHAPADATVTRVAVRVGPMRGVVEDAMQWAWQAATDDTPYADSALDLEMLRWRLRCPDCGREFEADELFVECECGCGRPTPIGGDELALVSLDVEDMPDPRPEPQECHHETG